MNFFCYKPDEDLLQFKIETTGRDLRNDSTRSEVLLWNEIKARKLQGYQFMRQKPIGNFIVDLFCSPLKLVIEIDGSSHDNKEVYDRKRQLYLESLGLTVLRFDDLMVKKDIQYVLDTLRNWIIKNESTID